MTRVVVLAAVEADLDDLSSYIAKDDVDAALRVVRELRETFSSLRDHPRRHRVRPEYGADVRLIPLRSYVVAYVFHEDTDTVEVLRVLHGSRDLTVLL